MASRGPQARTFAEWAASFAPDADRVMLGYVVMVWAGRSPTEFQSWLLECAGPPGCVGVCGTRWRGHGGLGGGLPGMEASAVAKAYRQTR